MTTHDNTYNKLMAVETKWKWSKGCLHSTSYSKQKNLKGSAQTKMPRLLITLMLMINT